MIISNFSLELEQLKFDMGCAMQPTDLFERIENGDGQLQFRRI